MGESQSAYDGIVKALEGHEFHHKVDGCTYIFQNISSFPSHNSNPFVFKRIHARGIPIYFTLEGLKDLELIPESELEKTADSA